MNTNSRHIAIEAIKKKLVGKKLSYKEIYAIMDEIASKRFGPILTTYFAAAGFREGFTDTELYYLTKAMVETGPQLKFRGIVADKHSTGGVAGTRTTMVIVPIIAAAGFHIPKTSSRAITSPAGTADTMEVLSPVTFSPKQIRSLVTKVGGCIVWGGHLGLAPADDIIIETEQPLAFESYDKIIVSIMAKKVASGSTHLVLDVPVGPTLKIQHFKDAEIIARKFSYLASRFNINVIVDVNEMKQNAGKGIGPALEARDVLQILEQQNDRPLALEAKALQLAGKLLSLCLHTSSRHSGDKGEILARNLLTSGKALDKMREIIRIQGGNPDVSSDQISLGKYKYEITTKSSGTVITINNKTITVVSRILGCPSDKKAGIYLNKKLEEKVEKDGILCTLYSSDTYRLKEAVATVRTMPIYTVQ
ncbi:thymidine phosphorylase [Patescibacteria group bacterium]